MLRSSDGKSSYNAFMPIYPLLAQQCVDDYGLSEGICLDIGTGSGFVGTEIGKITNMKIYYIDIEDKALASARQTVEEAYIDNEVFFVKADVCKELPFEDSFADFIVSRGSIWFWEDPIKAVAEIYRVLNTSGVALIGGGLGRYTPLTMRRRLTGERKNYLKRKGGQRLSPQEMKQLALSAQIPSFRVVPDAPGDKGIWLEIHKYR